MKLLLLAVFVSTIFSSKSFAYETMIRFRYANCMTCHHSSTGGGSLNAYGKVIASETSTFKSKKLPQAKKWEHGLQARLSHVQKGDWTRNFPMQLDYLAAFKGKKITFEGVLAKTPTDNLSKKPKFEEQFFLRKALLTYAFNKNLHIQMGRDYLDVGLNLVDHTLLLRSRNKRSVSDFFTVLRGVYYSQGYKLAPYVFLPSFQESYDNKEKGGGVKMEKYLTRWRSVISFSQLMGDTSKIFRQESALAFKTGFNILTFLGQASFTSRKIHETGTKFDQSAYLFSAHLFPFKSLELKIDVEKLFISAPFDRKVAYSNNGIIWKPWRNISLQYNAKRNIDQKSEFQSIYQIYFNGWFL